MLGFLNYLGFLSGRRFDLVGDPRTYLGSSIYLGFVRGCGLNHWGSSADGDSIIVGYVNPRLNQSSGSSSAGADLALVAGPEVNFGVLLK